MDWLSGGRPHVRKQHFFVWYLGSVSVDGLRGDHHCTPAIRHLLKDSQRRFPEKVSLCVSGKGLKLTKTVAAMGKSGKLKSEIVKLSTPAHAITFCSLGAAPFNDVVAIVLLQPQSDTKSPVHVHCYRADSADSALLLSVAVQTLLNDAVHQKRLTLIERRLIQQGMLRGAQSTNQQRHGAPLIYKSNVALDKAPSSNGGSIPIGGRTRDAYLRHHDAHSSQSNLLAQRFQAGSQPNLHNIGMTQNVMTGVGRQRQYRQRQQPHEFHQQFGQNQHPNMRRSHQNLTDIAPRSTDDYESDTNNNVASKPLPPLPTNPPSAKRLEPKRTYRPAPPPPPQHYLSASVERDRRLHKNLIYELRDALHISPTTAESSERSSEYGSGREALRSEERRARGEAPPESATSSTSGFASDEQAVSQEGNKMRRLSVADIQNAWRIDDQLVSTDRSPSPPLPIPPRQPNGRRYQKVHEQKMQLRMFGDTIGKSNAPLERSAWRSLDNLLLAAREQDATLQPKVTPPRRTVEHHRSNGDLRQTSGDGFWMDRAKRAECFVNNTHTQHYLQ